VQFILKVMTFLPSLGTLSIDPIGKLEGDFYEKRIT